MCAKVEEMLRKVDQTKERIDKRFPHLPILYITLRCFVDKTRDQT